MSYRALLVAAVASACNPPPGVGEQVEGLHAARTVVALTFDDTFADNYQVGAIAEARGMNATFFVNSGRIGQAGYLTLAQLGELEAAGHEIGGHTISHARLSALDEPEVRRQVCDDRVALLDLGFRVTSFAYPFNAHNEMVREVVAECGYNSARMVGGLASANSCAGCPWGNPRPPPDPYQLRTHASVKADTTLAELQAYVTGAEDNGGGFVPIVFHHVCDGCDSLAVSPATLAAFLDWLEPRESIGTYVATVDEAIGGSLQPGVPAEPPPPPPTGGNLLQNASLETDANGDEVPDCWQRGGYGTNTATFTLTTNAFDGARAQRIDVTSYTSGARRLVSQQDLGSCAPAVTPGRQYTVTARYIADVQPLFSIYYRTASGGWVWFAQSPRFPATSTYQLATYTTPAMPAEATAISVGLSITAVGSLTTDAYTLVDAAGDVTPPTVALTSPADGATVSGTVTLAADAADASGIARVEFFVDGNLVATELTAPYELAFDTGPYAGTTITLVARAVDNAGNSTDSASRQITVQAAGDTTPPTVALTSPADGATVSGTVTLAADATDASGIAQVEFLVDGVVVGTDLTSPYAATWDSSVAAGSTVTLTARAADTAGNTATSASRQVMVEAAGDVTPPTVALTSPADGATVSGTVTLAADAADAGGIARVEFYFDSTLVATEFTAPYELAFDTSPYAGTTITLVARAVDNAGNTTDSASRQVTVQAAGDTTPPTVALTSPADGATVSGTVTLAADATDASGIAQVEFLVDGAVVGTDTTSPYAVAWDAAAAGSTVTLTARATDAAGNTATSTSRQVTVAAANMIQNASLEVDANGDQVPDCWQRGGSGTNTGTFTLTSEAFAGSVAQRIDISSYTSGAKRIVTLQDSGTCAPAATPGRRYTVTARYIATGQPVFTVYYRNASGSWVWWTQSPKLPASSAYALGTYTTPQLPAGATAISVGLSIIYTGALTMDDFTLVDAGP